MVSALARSSSPALVTRWPQFQINTLLAISAAKSRGAQTQQRRFLEIEKS